MMSKFTFGHNVFKSHLLLLRQIASAGGKWLSALRGEVVRASDSVAGLQGPILGSASLFFGLGYESSIATHVLVLG